MRLAPKLQVETPVDAKVGTKAKKNVKARTRVGSIATRLFLSAAILSFAILFIAGLVLSTIYQRDRRGQFR